MKERIREEVELLRARFPGLTYIESGHWVRLTKVSVPPPWSPGEIEVAFQFPPAGYPANAFYGFYVPSGFRLDGRSPQNFQDPAPSQPPFDDQTWAFFSGNPEPWDPRADIRAGSNAVTWVQSIFERFKEHI